MSATILPAVCRRGRTPLSRLELRAPPSCPPPSLTPSSAVVAPSSQSSVSPALLLPLACCCCFLATASTCCYVFPPDVPDPCAGKTCSFGAHCVASIDGLQSRCQCLESCNSYGDSIDSWPVCSTDGVDYRNVCEMRKASCRLMTDVEKKYDGKCGEYDALRRRIFIPFCCISLLHVLCFLFFIYRCVCVLLCCRFGTIK